MPRPKPPHLIQYVRTRVMCRTLQQGPIPPQPPSPHPKPYNFPGIKQCAARSSGE